MKIQYFVSRKIQWRIFPFCLGFLLAIIVNMGIGFPLLSLSAQTSPRSIRPEIAAPMVQQQLSFLALENDYLSQESGQVSSNNTLLLRLIRYHEYVKSRPLTYRFDWQLTFADYFGINEPIKSNRYPGHRTLVENPLEGDRKIITSLNREQRNQLINSLLAIYNPKSLVADPVVPSENNEAVETNSQPQKPQRGSADLLLPVKALPAKK